MATHEIKTTAALFEELRALRLSSDYRRDDYGYAVDDVLILRELSGPPPSYTGRRIKRRVTHVLRHADLADVPEGWVVLSLTPEAPTIKPEVGAFVPETVAGVVPPDQVLLGALAAGIREVAVVGLVDAARGGSELYLAHTETPAEACLMLARGLRSIVEGADA